MIEPKFSEASDYYYDVNNNIIHGRNKGSYLYYHELSHYLDHLNPRYAKFSHFMSLYGQFTAWSFGIFALYGLNLDTYDYIMLMGRFLLIYGFYAAWVIQEEGRAYVRGYLLWKKAKKTQN